MNRAVRAATGSVVVSCVVLALKGAAWSATGSVALFADAAESVVNVVAALAALAAILYAARPADANHPYGHDKAEYFSAVLEGAMILLAAGSILWESWKAITGPGHHLDAPWLGLGISSIATLLNAGWATLLGRIGRKPHSPALLADARHLWSDVVTSIGVLVGVVLVAVTGIGWLDAVVAAITALGIVWSGWQLLRESVGGLMDEAVPPDQLTQIREIVARHAEGALEAHDLRTRHTGHHTYLEFHLVVPGAMQVSAAHAICDRIEDGLRHALGNVVVTIHVEPEGKAKHHGVLVL